MQALEQGLDEIRLCDPELTYDTLAAAAAATGDGVDDATATPAMRQLVAGLTRLLSKGGGEAVVYLRAQVEPPQDMGERRRARDTRLDIQVPYTEQAQMVAVCATAARAAQACATQQCTSAEKGETVMLVRAEPKSVEDHIELRVAVVGNVDAGKSTMLGVLTKGTLDDGRGRARVDLFRHKHEYETGRTSSVGTEVMGFYANGEPVVKMREESSAVSRKLAWEDVCQDAAKVISFIDLAGHERYLKTTVFGMTGCLPDYVMLMVGANAGLVGMCKEHLGIALALGVPVAVVVTKVDMCPPQILDATLKQLVKVLQSPGCRKTPVFLESREQMIDAALQLPVERICPVFQVSNVTGQHLDLLRDFLNILPSSQARFAPLQSGPVEMPISDIFSVPFVGTVVSGVLTSGVVNTGDPLLLGPDGLGQFMPTWVRSIQRKRVNVECATAGQSVSFALKRIRRNQVRKGMVLVSRGNAPPKVHYEFEAEVLCLYHSTTLSLGSCIVLHASSIRQSVKIMAITKMESSHASRAAVKRSQPVDETKPVVRMGDRARVRLRFMSTAEYIQPGTRLIAREYVASLIQRKANHGRGKTKLVGIVRDVGEPTGGSTLGGMPASPGGPTPAPAPLHTAAPGTQLSGAA